MLNKYPLKQGLKLQRGKSLDSPEKGHVDKMSEKCQKCPNNVQKLSGGDNHLGLFLASEVMCSLVRLFLKIDVEDSLGNSNCARTETS